MLFIDFNRQDSKPNHCWSNSKYVGRTVNMIDCQLISNVIFMIPSTSSGQTEVEKEAKLIVYTESGYSVHTERGNVINLRI